MKEKRKSAVLGLRGAMVWFCLLVGLRGCRGAGCPVESAV